MTMPVHDVYEAMVVAVAQVGREIPGVDHALRDAIAHVAQAIAWIEARDPEPAATRFAAHRAYLGVLAVGQALVGVPRAASAVAAIAAVDAVLDTLAPHVSGADRALRRVLIDGDPLRRVSCG
jgi:hypothetical protein